MANLINSSIQKRPEALFYKGLWTIAPQLSEESPHVAVVFARYMIIALEQRKSEDVRTLGEIFFFLSNELEDITFRKSMSILMEAMIASIKETFKVSQDQISSLIESFFNRLPSYLQDALSKMQSAS